MAMPRLFKFLLGLVILFFVVGVLAIFGVWMAMSRGPSIPDHSTLVLRIGGDLVETPPNDVLGQLTGGGRRRSGATSRRSVARKPTRGSTRTDRPDSDSVPLLGQGPGDSGCRHRFPFIGQASVRVPRIRRGARVLPRDRCRSHLPRAVGSLDVAGLATYEVFLKGTLDKIGAQADFEKIGDYKTAPNQLTQTTFTPAHREMTESLTRDMYEQLVRAIAERRKKKVEDVRALIDEGPFLARDAHRLGLVDALAYEDQLDDHGAVSKSGTAEGELYMRTRRTTLPRSAPRIAVVYVSGIINSGDSGFDPLNGDVAGSSLVKAIQSARADDDVRAIVVRIDSPGGSSIASDVIGASSP